MQLTRRLGSIAKINKSVLSTSTRNFAYPARAEKAVFPHKFHSYMKTLDGEVDTQAEEYLSNYD